MTDHCQPLHWAVDKKCPFLPECNVGLSSIRAGFSRWTHLSP